MSSNENVHLNFDRKNDEKLLRQAFIVKSEERQPLSDTSHTQAFILTSSCCRSASFVLVQLSRCEEWSNLHTDGFQ